MRCYPLCVIVLALVSALPLAEARVGETKSDMESRLMRNRRVIEYPARYLERKLQEPRSRVPYREYLPHFAEGSVHTIYFKKAEDATVSRSDLDTSAFPDGWDLHVVYYQNISVFE